MLRLRTAARLDDIQPDRARLRDLAAEKAGWRGVSSKRKGLNHYQVQPLYFADSPSRRFRGLPIL